MDDDAKSEDHPPEPEAVSREGLKADMWALGCLLLALVTGEEPYSQSPSPIAAIRQGAPPPELMNCSASESLLQLITLLLQPNPRVSSHASCLCYSSYAETPC